MTELSATNIILWKENTYKGGQNLMEEGRQKKLWKQWWVWVLAVFVLLIITNGTSNIEGESTEEGPIGYTQEEVASVKEKIEESFTEDDMVELEEITWMAIDLLPDDEKDILLNLHDKFLHGGYDALSDQEIETMQALNKKAIGLLPKDYQDRIMHLMQKSAE